MKTIDYEERVKLLATLSKLQTELNNENAVLPYQLYRLILVLRRVIELLPLGD